MSQQGSIKRRPCWSAIKPVRITFSRIGRSSPDRHNLGFLTEGKSAAILITPSSWGFQRAGHSPRIKQQFFGAVAGEEWKTSARGVFRTHILYFVIVLLYFIYFTCIVLYQKPKKN
jgi:hypothetical protein